MDTLPLEVQSLIINQIPIKCHCINICKAWEKLLKENPINNDFITCISNKDYYAIQLNCFKFPYIITECKIINEITKVNDSLIYKIILKTIYEKILPESDSIIMYFKIDTENSTILNCTIENIISMGNYEALSYFLDIHNNSGFPENLFRMSNITNIVDTIKYVGEHEFEHFKMIDNLMKDENISWGSEDLGFIVQMLSISFDEFYDQIKRTKFGKPIKKLICPTIKDRIYIMDKKAYLESIRHGLHNISNKIAPINDMDKNEDNQVIFFLLALSGNSGLRDIKRLYHIDYHSWYDKKMINDNVDILGIKERYEELLRLI